MLARMELHDAIRDVVARHGEAMLADSAGFRGVLDDVLAEDQASTGDINLLADAVRLDVLAPLTAMIDSGADAGRAVEEAGARLARDRGGDQFSSSWAAAVLGYAVGRVPEAIVLRYRSQRPPSHLSPPSGFAAAPAAPPPPPVTSPPPYWSAPTPAPAPRGRRTGLVAVAAAVAGVVVVGGGITALVLASGGEDPAPKDPGATGSAEVDVAPEALDTRYDALASAISKGTSDCRAGSPGPGQREVVDCTVSAGTLRLVTYADEDAAKAARTARLDYRAGTMTADAGTTALYEYDPERGGTSDPALVYWDSTSARQSATLTGTGTAGIDTLTELHAATSPRVVAPTAPADPVLREFVDLNLELSGCTRQRTFFAGETEESKCDVGVPGIVVNIGRYRDRKGLTDDRAYYKSQFDKARKRGGSGTWRFGKGPAEGAYYAYLDSSGKTATLYWDWDEAGCNCYGVAWSFQGDLKKLETWWPPDDD